MPKKPEPEEVTAAPMPAPPTPLEIARRLGISESEVIAAQEGRS